MDRFDVIVVGAWIERRRGRRAPDRRPRLPGAAARGRPRFPERRNHSAALHRQRRAQLEDGGDPRIRLGLLQRRPLGNAERPGAAAAARQADGRHIDGQCDDRRPRRAVRLRPLGGDGQCRAGRGRTCCPTSSKSRPTSISATSRSTATAARSSSSAIKPESWAPINRVMYEACVELGIREAPDLNGLDAHAGVVGVDAAQPLQGSRLGTLVTTYAPREAPEPHHPRRRGRDRVHAVGRQGGRRRLRRLPTGTCSDGAMPTRS